MLSFIKTNYQIGDTIEVNCSEGIIAGQIEFVNHKYIVLRQQNGKICGIAASDIRTFTAPTPQSVVWEQSPVTHAPEVEEDKMGSDEAELQDYDTESREGTQAQEDDNLDNHTDKIENLEVPTIAAPKVVGQIDLQRIDPRLEHRSYFHSNDMHGNDKNNGEQSAHHANNYWQQDDYSHKPFIAAKGRVTYYNPDKRYGFIRDFASDNDLYFYMQNIIDSDLYNQLRKGTKVTYSIDRNPQGFIARNIHLPRPVSELLYMIEGHLDARRIHAAEGMIDHILEVYPDNEDAKDLLDQVHDMTPAPRFAPVEPNGSSTQYNPYATYTKAKRAYLEKDYDQAESLYLQAIEKGEKVESCIKDLVTLYVSRFKQVETDEEKDEARQKAVTFLDKHRPLLPDNLTTKQFLALNYYLPIQDYEKFIHIVDEIMEDPEVSQVVSRRVFYIWQKGIALNKLGHSEDALALAEEGLKLAPRSRQLQNLRDYILYPPYENNNAADETSAVADNNSDESDTNTAPTDNATNKPSANDQTGDPKPDSWWDELKKPAEL